MSRHTEPSAVRLSHEITAEISCRRRIGGDIRNRGDDGTLSLGKRAICQNRG